MQDQDELKRLAAQEAAKEVHRGMLLGLGTGSTARFLVDLLGERFQRGELPGLIGVPTSEATRLQAERWGIPLAPIDRYPRIDLAIDGADEVDPSLDLVKGLGGALLREKAVELVARRFVVVADDSKRVPRLGTKAPIPVEVDPGHTDSLGTALAALGCVPSLRRAGGEPFRTDQGNHILDCRFAAGIGDPYGLARALDALPGVRAHGLFLGMADEVILASKTGIERVGRVPARGG